MKAAALIAAGVAVATLSWPVGAYAQDCQCGGKDPEIFSGGDGAPLRWLYETKLLAPATTSGPATRCYHRSVTNNSNATVRDIRWEIANFSRRVIFAKHVNGSCPPIQGDVKAQPSLGPLYFDVSSQGYETTTRQPERGWTEASINPKNTDGGNLRTVVSFDVDTGTGPAGTSGSLTFDSRAWKNETTNTLEYGIINQSDVPLKVLVNLPATPQLAEAVPMVQEPFKLMPKQGVGFKASISGPVHSGLFSILITDDAGHVVGVDSGGFWFPAEGKLRRSNEDIWKQATTK